MKKARIILLTAIPVVLILSLLGAKIGLIRHAITGNILACILFSLPITAMLLMTIENKDKNLDMATYRLKLLFVFLLYLMVAFMFATVLYGNLR